MSARNYNNPESMLAKHQEMERAAVAAITGFAKENKELLQYIAHWGDGRGGYISALILDELNMLPQAATSQAKSNRPTVSRAKRNFVFDLFGNQCLSCKSYDDICIDHVTPLAKGGENSVENMQPLCRTCNSAKGVKSTDYRGVTGNE